MDPQQQPETNPFDQFFEEENSAVEPTSTSNNEPASALPIDNTPPTPYQPTEPATAPAMFAMNTPDFTPQPTQEPVGIAPEPMIPPTTVVEEAPMPVETLVTTDTPEPLTINIPETDATEDPATEPLVAAPLDLPTTDTDEPIALDPEMFEQDMPEEIPPQTPDEPTESDISAESNEEIVQEINYDGYPPTNEQVSRRRISFGLILFIAMILVGFLGTLLLTGNLFT